MGLLKRLSDYIWSPAKPDTISVEAPQTLPRAQKRARPQGPRKASLQHVLKNTRSMSPVARVDSWQAESVSDVPSNRKRKAPLTPSTGRQSKFIKQEEEDSEYLGVYETSGSEDGATDDHSDIEDVEEPDSSVDYDDEEEEQLGANTIKVGRSTSPAADHSSLYEEEPEADTSLVATEAYESPYRKKIVSPTKDRFDRGITDEELRAQGWDDDHIELVQKIAMRGYEPVLPLFSKFSWPHYPDALFCDNDEDAFIASVRGDHWRGEKALARLFEMGGRVRDRVLLNGRVTPEMQVTIMMKEYIKWCNKDSGIDPKTAIPLLVLENKPKSVPVAELYASARKKLEKLAQRYREAFRVRPSVEGSPMSRASTVLSYPMPTLYAIISSGLTIGITAYRPEDEDPRIHLAVMLKMDDKAYDVWNPMALAMTVCHLRNVQMRIADETGLGVKAPDSEDTEEDDPDA